MLRQNKLPLSIILPIYNPGEYFLTTLKSIKNQSFQNFEVIVSDDSEKSHSFSEAYFETFDFRFKYRKNDRPKGIFSNINGAIEVSVGRYIQLFCQDDIMLNDFLKYQYELVTKMYDKNLGFCFSNYHTLPLTTSYRSDIIATEVGFYSRTTANDALVKYIERGCLPGNISSCIIPISTIKKIGLFNKEYTYAGDFEYWVRIAMEGLDYAYSSGKNLIIRQHDSQASNILPWESLSNQLGHIYKMLISITNSGQAGLLKINHRVGLHLLIKGLKYKIGLYKLFTALNREPFRIRIILTSLIKKTLSRKN